MGFNNRLYSMGSSTGKEGSFVSRQSGTVMLGALEQARSADMTNRLSIVRQSLIAPSNAAVVGSSRRSTVVTSAQRDTTVATTELQTATTELLTPATDAQQDETKRLSSNPPPTPVTPDQAPPPSPASPVKPDEKFEDGKLLVVPEPAHVPLSGNQLSWKSSSSLYIARLNDRPPSYRTNLS
ncbi:hypothetical protein HK102_010360 [Quaeritorhiza haematococci]|nr:hypothetical protein HK102_010360 [Quaeritorhiza haematococci]